MSKRKVPVVPGAEDADAIASPPTQPSDTLPADAPDRIWSALNSSSSLLRSIDALAINVVPDLDDEHTASMVVAISRLARDIHLLLDSCCEVIGRAPFGGFEDDLRA